MRKNKAWFVIMLTLMITLGCTNQSEQKEVRKVRVKSLTISPTQVMGGKEFVGTIEEKDGAVVSFNVLGTVTRVYAEEGQMVKKG